MALLEPVHVWLRRSLRRAPWPPPSPLGWIFEPPTPIWRKALNTRPTSSSTSWTWYEWLGALAPLFLFWLLWRIAQKRGETLLARFALAVFAYGVFQQAVAMVMLGSPSLVRLTPLQPMRFLHLIYFFMALMAGCLLGKYLLKASVWRWAVFLLVINGGMFAAQRAALQQQPTTSNCPGRAPSNPWLQAFAWIRINTPDRRLLRPGSALPCSAWRGLPQLPRARRAQPAGRRHQGHRRRHPGSRARPGLGAPGRRASRLDQLSARRLRAAEGRVRRRLGPGHLSRSPRASPAAGTTTPSPSARFP